jgi:hypothetical protein
MFPVRVVEKRKASPRFRKTGYVVYNRWPFVEHRQNYLCPGWKYLRNGSATALPSSRAVGAESNEIHLSRPMVLQQMACGFGGIALSGLLASEAAAPQDYLARRNPLFPKPPEVAWRLGNSSHK